MDEPIRIDKYLWAVRLYKTRSLATDACRCGHVRMNGQPLKPSHEIKAGEIYEVSIEQLHRVIPPQEEYERIQMVRQYAFEKRDRGSGRPTKRERRDIEEFKYK